MKTFINVAQMKLASLKEGQFVETGGYYTKGDAGQAKYLIVAAQAADGWGDHTLANGTVAVLQVGGGTIYSEQWGVAAGQDSTRALQGLNDYLELIGGGVVVHPIATISNPILISMSESTHPNACVVIPANTEYHGLGMYTTVFTRPSAERGTDGVLFVNKYYDTVDGYAAAGNITFRKLGITDGATTPTRSLGDLIGFGNGDGLRVLDCYFGNHDQHAVDIAKSRNVWIERCVSENYVNQSLSGTYQIDAGAIWGIFGAGHSYNIWIDSNEGKYTLASTGYCHIGHGGNSGKNINIINNIFDGTMLTGSRSVIESDNDCSFDQLTISNNKILLDDNSVRAINIPILVTERAEAIDISRNDISGKFKNAIFVGSGTPPTGSFGTIQLNSISVNNNNILHAIDADVSSDVNLIFVGFFRECKVHNNYIITSIVAQTGDVVFINDANCRRSQIENNVIESISNFASFTTYGISSDKSYFVNQDLSCDVRVSGNNVVLANPQYHININAGVESLINYTKATGYISKNTMDGGVIGSNLFDGLWLSDGTNNLGYVDFGANSEANDQHVRAVATSNHYQNIPMTGTRLSGNSGSYGGAITCKIEYSPSTNNGFATDQEEVNIAYISPTQSAGMFVKDINVGSGNFDLVTGTDGTNFIFNDSSFAPVLRGAGFIRVLTGI